MPFFAVSNMIKKPNQKEPHRKANPPEVIQTENGTFSFESIAIANSFKCGKINMLTRNKMKPDIMRVTEYFQSLALSDTVILNINSSSTAHSHK